MSGSQKKCLEDTVSEDTIAIAHDDDLQLIKDVVRPKSKCRNLYLKSTINAPVQETLTADAIEKFLREKQMTLRVENNGKCFCTANRHDR
jgi:hypothetical protein